MSETKLCPFRSRLLMPPRLSGESDWATIAPNFAPCLEEKCAMWRKVWWEAPDPKNDNIERVVIEGHCGLAGKP